MADADYQLRLETSSAERVRAPDSREALEPELQLHADAEEAVGVIVTSHYLLFDIIIVFTACN